MASTTDIATFNRLRQEDRLFQFLTGINDRFDADRKKILRTVPLPTVEVAYATIRRETSRRAIMSGTTVVEKSEALHSEIGSGLVTKSRSDKGKAQSSSRSGESGKNRSEKVKEEEVDKSKLKCSTAAELDTPRMDVLN